MKLIELAQNVKKTSRNEKSIDIDAITTALNINFNHYDYYDKIKEHITAYWVTPWLCTDTMVGLAVYFLDGTLIGVSFQRGRKYAEEFDFISMEMAKNTYDFFMSLRSPHEDFSIISQVDLDGEWDEHGFEAFYASSICVDTVWYKPSQEYVKVCNRYRYDYNMPSNVIEVMFDNGERKVVELENILVPYGLEEV